MKKPTLLPTVNFRDTWKVGEFVVGVGLDVVFMKLFELIVSTVDRVVLTEGRHCNLVDNVSLLDKIARTSDTCS